VLGVDPNQLNGPASTGSLTALVTREQTGFDASVRETTFNLQGVLNQLGLPATVTDEPSGGKRIVSSAPRGERFVLLLRPQATGRRTQVTVQWETPADRRSGVKALAELEGETNNSRRAQK
jgi:hypothetical protein